METFSIPSGMYAVIQYKGLDTTTKLFEYIYETGLAASKNSIAKKT